MAESAVEVTQREVGAKDAVDKEENWVAITEGELEHVESHVFIAHTGGGATNASEALTHDAFEGALDRVSRPTGRGKLAHLRPNSEEFAGRKQEEIDLEERSR